jgi:hypothetical protein
MTKREAINRAQKRSKETGHSFWVIREYDEDMPAERCFQVCDDSEPDTYFSGVQIIAPYEKQQLNAHLGAINA